MGLEELNNTDESLLWLKEYKNSSDDKVKNQLKNLIVATYMPLVKKISHGLARRSTDPTEDIIQVGFVGLLKAIEQFDVTVGSSFKTYATYMITGEIRHYLRDKTNMIRAPRELQELSYRINQLTQKLAAKLDRAPTNTELSKELAIPVARVAEIIEVDRRKQMLSLDQVISGNSDNEQSLGDKLIDNKSYDKMQLQENKIMLLEAIDRLDDKLKVVVKLSFFEDLSQNEIAQKLDISQMQVSRRLKKALEELFIIITKKKIG